MKQRLSFTTDSPHWEAFLRNHGSLTDITVEDVPEPLVQRFDVTLTRADGIQSGFSAHAIHRAIEETFSVFRNGTWMIDVTELS